jgi:hypothetical protein
VCYETAKNHVLKGREALTMGKGAAPTMSSGRRKTPHTKVCDASQT